MELWIATSNRGKLDEFKSLLMESGLDIHSQSELSTYATPIENGDSFEANARIKARSLKALKPGTWVVADDSGLEVKGLNNLPGIHSARYAGEKASDAENNAKLLKMVGLRTAMNRQAQFRCCLVVYDPDGNEHIFNGLLEGIISKAAKGTQGFGYDPVFIPKGEEKTLAELGPATKNSMSHRARAIKAFAELLKPPST